MKISKTAAVGLLVALGFRSSGTKSIKELVAKIKDIPDFYDPKSKQIAKDVAAAGHKDLLAKILTALKKKEEITVEGDPKGPPAAQAKAAAKAKSKPQEDDEDDTDEEEEESEDDEDADEDSDEEGEGEEDEESEEEESEDEGDEESEDEEETDSEEDEDEDGEDESEDEEEEDEEPAPKKKAAQKSTGKDTGKGKGGKADKKDKPKEKKSAVATDKWGCKIGSRAARLNAAITGKPKTAKQIQTDAKYDKPIHGHLRFLIAKGFIVNENGKYRSKQGGEPIKSTKPAAKPVAKTAPAKKGKK